MNARSGQRLARLQEALSRGGTLPLTEAAKLCNVSEMTIRRDVAASDGSVKFLGGHLIMAEDPLYRPVYNLDEEQGSHALVKQCLCQRAAALIEDGDTLFIDCGTTLMPLIEALDRDMTLTVVTYALNVGNAVSRLPNVRLLLLGGLYYSSSMSFGGDEMDAAIRRLGINKAFISAAGLHAGRGASCFHFHEVAPKQAAIASAMQRILVIDDSKLDVIRPAFFASLDSFDIIITNGEAGLALQESHQGVAAGPQILLA
ncbi:DeoR family transcriptional regulator [Phytohalomonas tamaricis]|uniref:DeoR family transcriptional regulator n=1 Tax=Phytohalomonas tamaricis TaxID=2081032 RepID=UPI000D0B3F4A|nr:DeoR family transcriptional regulator [Phytohalomonas tamaricis]